MADEKPQPSFGELQEKYWSEITGPAEGPTPPLVVRILTSFFRGFNFTVKLGWNDLIVAAFSALWRSWSTFAVWLGGAEDDVWKVFTQFLEENKILTSKQADLLLRFKGMPTPFKSLSNLMIIASFIKGYSETLYGAASAETRGKAMAEFRPTLLDQNTAIQNAFLDPTKTTQVKEILARHGFRDDYIDMLFLSAYALHGEQTLRELFHRGEKSETDVLAALSQRGFTELRAKEIMSVWKFIPPLGDLMSMAAGKSFNADLITKYGLLEGLPVEVLDGGVKQGIPTEWIEKYWMARKWKPAPSLALEMLHRGLISPEEVNDAYDFAEVPGVWRDKLTAISYQPYSRIDIRRMHKAGSIKDSELIPLYKEIGFADDKAAQMAAFTIQYNNASYRDLGQSQIVKAYRDSMISRDDAHDLLIALNYDEPTVEWILSMADWEEQLEIQTLYVSSIQENYKAARIGENDARAALMKLNLPGARIDALIEKWKPTRITETKMVSKTDLDKMFRAKVIDADTYKSEMYKLGYSWQYTSWYYSLLTGGKA